MVEFKQGCCECCDMGAGPCLLTTFCPCIAYYQAANNIGDDCAIVYLIVGFCGLNCCSVCVLGNNVAKKRNINMGLCKSGCCALFDACKWCAVDKSSKSSSSFFLYKELMSNSTVVVCYARQEDLWCSLLLGYSHLTSCCRFSFATFLFFIDTNTIFTIGMCYSCTVVAECKDVKAKGGAPSASGMER
jgi:hypothetical protein